MESNPYLKAIYVYNSYADKHFEINFEADENSDTPFRHLILTGKNGSGKTTILKCINEELSSFFANTLQDSFYYNNEKNAESLLVNIPSAKVEICFNKLPQTQNWVYVALGSKRTLEVNDAVRDQQINFKQYKDNAFEIYNLRRSLLYNKNEFETQIKDIQIQIQLLFKQIIENKEIPLNSKLDKDTYILISNNLHI